VIEIYKNKIGENDQTQTSMKTILISWLNIMKLNTTQINYSYKDIQNNSFLLSQREKNDITKRLQNMSSTEREAFEAIKHAGMGENAIGRTELIRNYDPKEYDKNVDFQKQNQNQENIQNADDIQNADNADADDVGNDLIYDHENSEGEDDNDNNRDDHDF
jgi:hypothetical protein